MKIVKKNYGSNEIKDLGMRLRISLSEILKMMSPFMSQARKPFSDTKWAKNSSPPRKIICNRRVFGADIIINIISLSP